MSKLLSLALLVGGIMGISLGGATGRAQESTPYCLRYPQRMISSTQVDLRGLMAWWTNAQALQLRPTIQTNTEPGLSPRPLSSWVRVKGSICSEGMMGWIVEADIEERPGASAHSRILLVHPPKEEKQKFDRLKAESRQDQETQASANTAADANQEIADEASSKAAALDTISSGSPLLTYLVQGDELGYSRAAGNASDRKKIMVTKSTAASEAASEADHELEEMPPGEQYTVDFFALRLGQEYQGLSIYDLGTMIRP